MLICPKWKLTDCFEHQKATSTEINLPGGCGRTRHATVDSRAHSTPKVNDRVKVVTLINTNMKVDAHSLRLGLYLLRGCSGAQIYTKTWKGFDICSFFLRVLGGLHYLLLSGLLSAEMTSCWQLSWQQLILPNSH